MSCSKWAALIAVTFLFADTSWAQPAKSQRKLGAGVLQVIPPEIKPEETRTYLPKIRGFEPPVFEPQTAPSTVTNAFQTQNITLRREIGCFEFAFTSLQVRVMEVPQPSGKMQRKTIWYLPYRIRNLGAHFVPQDMDATANAKFKQSTVIVPGASVPDTTGLLGEDRNPYQIPETEREELEIDVDRMADIAKRDYQELKTGGLARSDTTSKYSMIDRFFGRFILEGRVQTDFSLEKTPTPFGLRDKPGDSTMSRYEKKEYLDQIIPSLIPKIRRIEDPATKFYDTVSISRINIPADSDPDSAGVWGVAVWQDLDPRLDYISIYVTGLSNAFQMFELPDGKKKFKHKTLQLNFWRPGDIHDEPEDQVRYGIPLTRDPQKQKEICEFYELPGPVISVQEYDRVTDKKRELFIVEGEVDRNFELDLRTGLDAGTLPDPIQKMFIVHGIDVPPGAPVTQVVEADNIAEPGTSQGIRWNLAVDVDGQERNFRLIFRPRSWQKIGERIEIIKPLEHVWIYR